VDREGIRAATGTSTREEEIYGTSSICGLGRGGSAGLRGHHWDG
jgi:hypothetical protein